MKKKIKIYLKSLIFISLFIGLLGTFFNEKEQFSSGILGHLYGDSAMNIIALVSLLIGWVLWEFAVGKRKSNFIAAMAMFSFLIALGLEGHLFGFIGIGVAIFSIIPFMVYEFKFDFKYKIFNFLRRNK